MRSARLFPTLAAVTLALSLLAGCGGSSSSGKSSGGGSGGSSAGSAASGGSGSQSGSGSSGGSGSQSGSGSQASSGGKGLSCAVAPAAMVSAALGDTVTATQEDRTGDTVVVCDYKGAKVGLVKVRIQTDSSAAAFAVDKKGFTAQQMKTADESFVDEAFSNVVTAGSSTITTLVARRGSVEILVAAKATVAQEKGLLSQLFNKL